MQNIGENLDFKKLVEEDRKKIVEKNTIGEEQEASGGRVSQGSGQSEFQEVGQLHIV